MVMILSQASATHSEMVRSVRWSREIPLDLSGITFILTLMIIRNILACCGTQNKNGLELDGTQGTCISPKCVIVLWNLVHFLSFFFLFLANTTMIIIKLHFGKFPKQLPKKIGQNILQKLFLLIVTWQRIQFKSIQIFIQYPSQSGA